jgi:hypothetical protein
LVFGPGRLRQKGISGHKNGRKILAKGKRFSYKYSYNYLNEFLHKRREVMLPDCRIEEYLYTVPPFSIERDNAEDFVEKLREFHGKFSDCFVRSEPRGNFF